MASKLSSRTYDGKSVITAQILRYSARTKHSVMHYPRSMWAILLWLSSYLFHHVSPVLQQGGMKLTYTQEKNLEECVHCLLYEVGPTRLTPTHFSPATDTDWRVLEYKFIGSQFFYTFASNYCRGVTSCIDVETYNIHNIDESRVNLSPTLENVRDQPHKRVCLMKSKGSMDVLCASCLEEASRTQYFGQLHLLSYSGRQDIALLVMFSELTEAVIVKSCMTHCGTSVKSLKSPHCGHLLTTLLQESDEQPEFYWVDEGVQAINGVRRDGPKYSIKKEILQNHYCLIQKIVRSDFHTCKFCLAKRFDGLIVAVKTVRSRETNELLHAIHVFGTVNEGDDNVKQIVVCELCGTVHIKNIGDPACQIGFHNIFVKPQGMKQITAKKRQDTPELASPAVASECIWASKSENGSKCQSCLERYSPKVMKLSEHATLATITSYTLKSSAAQCVAASECDQVVFVPFPICNYEILLQEEPAANDAHRRNILSGSISSYTHFQKTQLWELLHKNLDSEITYTQDTRIPKRTRVDSGGFDLNIPASTMELEQVAVVLWRSEEPWKCLECLAMKESVIMISIKRSYAWVIDDDENLYRKGWKCPNCQLLQKLFSLSLDVRSMRSLSPIEIRNLYSLETKSKRGTSGSLPVPDPEAYDTSVFLDGKQPNSR